MLVNVHLKCLCLGMFDSIQQKLVSKLEKMVPITGQASSVL